MGAMLRSAHPPMRHLVGTQTRTRYWLKYGYQPLEEELTERDGSKIMANSMKSLFSSLGGGGKSAKQGIIGMSCACMHQHWPGDEGQ